MKNLKPKLIASSRGCMCFPSEPARTFYLFRVARGSRQRHPASILCLPGGPQPDGLDLERAAMEGRGGSGGCSGAPTGALQAQGSGPTHLQYLSTMSRSCCAVL